MKKPLKPKKPLANSSPPSKVIKIQKLLLFNESLQKWEAVDEVSHPKIFTFETNYIRGGEVIKEVNNELDPNWNELHNYSHRFEGGLSYKQYQQISHDIDLFDFTVCPNYNEDGYYRHSIIEYSAVDPEYNTKLEKYNNRFNLYAEALRAYEVELAKYEEYRKEKRRERLEEELQKLKETK